MKSKLMSLAILVACAGSALAQENVPNPVIENVADIGVLKYNGKYYLGGCRTDGNIYISSDLVNWSEPIYTIHMDNEWTKGTGAGDNQIHANDMIYDNGTFHAYWSVNYWGKDKHAVHVVHSEAGDVMGPYKEPDRTTWMDSRIDPKVFKDDDGQLYMYMVRFTEGNVLWARKMKNYREFSSDPIYLCNSLPDTWETMDNRVIEGPWVMKYRDQYYMMYNCNHTSTEWGNYQLGVAQADGPIDFHHGNKYSGPVVGSNQTTLEEKYVDLLRYSRQSYDPYFAYTESAPAANWYEADFDDAKWSKGEAGFASRKIKGSTTYAHNTDWKSPSLWLRKAFVVEKHGNLALRVTHRGATKIMLNGVTIYDKAKGDYCIVNLDKELAKALKEGENILAVETHQAGHRGGNYFDVSLFDMRNDIADDILMTPGQPNILRGPNGFEWWLIYMANMNNVGRSQYVDRVHFFDKTMYVDGITGPNTPGYHPQPALPTYGFTTETKAAGAFLDVQPSKAYLIESGVNTSSNAGLYAWWKDENNNAKVGLDAANNAWYLSVTVNGKTDCQSFRLAQDFRWGVYHNIRVERNKANLLVYLDEIPAPGQSRFCNVIPAAVGYPGTYGEGVFNGLAYTIGFDNVEMQLNENEEVVLGDNLTNYELSFQLYGLDNDKAAGCYPVYVDDKNYVKAMFNGVTGNLEVTTVVKGKVSKVQEYPLAHGRTVYPDVKYTDMVEKQYRFATPTWVDAIYLNRHEADRKAEFVDNMFEKHDVSYLVDGKWYSLDDSNATIAENPMYNKLSFAPVKIDGLRFINTEGPDTQRHLYKIGVNEALKESYNFRVVRNNAQVYLYIDGREVAAVDVTKLPASKVGLCAGNMYPSYKGVMYYHVGR